MLTKKDIAVQLSDSVQTIQTVLMAVEAEGEERGWDSELALPALFTVEKHGDQLSVDWQPQMNEILQLSLEKEEGHCGDALIRVARIFEKACALMPAPDELHRNLVAIGMRAEAWSVKLERHELAHTMPSEHPDRVETRVVWAFLRGEGPMSVYRQRGDQPELVTDPRMGGGVPHALTRILNAICPEGQAIASAELGDK